MFNSIDLTEVCPLIYNTSIILLRDQLGHSDIKTTSLYTNMSSKDGEKVLNEMEKRR